MTAPRRRLVEAMTVVVGRHGYSEASVARVVKQAGMSRATFYEQFRDRDDCFHAAFRQAAAPVWAELQPGRGRAAAADRPRAVIELLLAAADANPAAARLILVEAMAGGEEVCAAHEKLLTRIEGAVDRYLDGPGRQRLEIPARALLGGIANVVGMRVFRREGKLTALADELVAWLESFALPPGRRRLDQAGWDELGRRWCETAPAVPQVSPSERVVKRLPRGRSGLSPTEVAGDHRQRIIDAIARCSRERSYPQTTVADIVAAAGVARGAFYEQFRSKEDAYLAAQAHGLEGGAAVAAARFFTDSPWPERIFSAADGLLEYIGERPNLSHMQLVESYRVGPAAIRRSFENRMAFTIFLEDGYRHRPQAERLPRFASEAISAASEELFRHQVARGRAARARELTPQAAYVALAPFLGAAAALEFVTERCRRPA